MRDLLHNAEPIVSALIRNGHEWHSLFVDYHTPIVERMWTQIGKFRINILRIHPCRPEESLFHTHPWPSAIKILSGVYGMDTGYGEEDEEPPVATSVTLHEGDEYQMLNPHSWHRIYPLGNPSMSIMLTGEPWQRISPEKNTKLQPLTDDREKSIMNFCRVYYPRCVVRNASFIRFMAGKFGADPEDLEKMLIGKH